MMGCLTGLKTLHTLLRPCRSAESFSVCKKGAPFTLTSMGFTRILRVAVASFLTVAGSAEAVAPGKHYKPHDPVFIVANKVGPFNNPSETYEVRAENSMININ
jgi:hypothetical protein